MGNEMTTTDWIQAISTLILVMVTAVYVWLTNKQAKASVKMVEEMKNNRFEVLRPIVNITRSGWGNEHKSEGINLKFVNLGPGPALNVSCYLTDGSKRLGFEAARHIVLDKGGELEISFRFAMFNIKDLTGVCIKCEYESVYKQSFCSTLRFDKKIDKCLEILEIEQGDRGL